MAESDTSSVAVVVRDTQMTDGSDLHWESLDYCLSKDILVEGQSDLDWPRLGSKGTIQVTELETINFEMEQTEILSTNR